MESARIASLALVSAALSLFGCTSSNPVTTNDAGPSESVNGCTAADFAAHDLSAASASRTITFPMDATPAQYSPACITIGVGQSVTWNGNFANHPLMQSGGDPSMWIQSTSTGTTANFGFPVGGTYGFECMAHPTIMKGAVYVK